MSSLPYSTVEFPSLDGLVITADYYSVDSPRGFVLLCHRSHGNRAEYRETAQKLVRLGFSCLAIDQRSGMKIFGETNETSRRAKEQGLATGYLDAKIDVEAGIRHAYGLNGNKPVIVLGSSYSASLALICSVGNALVANVVFSPGEHLKGVSVQTEISGLEKHVFATSAKKEVEETRAVMKRVRPELVSLFEPTADGFHGSKTLWNSVPGNDQYWKALEAFLLTT